MKIILAVNGISPGDEVVKAACARPWPSGSYFCVLNVLDPYPFIRIPLLLERARAHIRQNLEDAADRLRGIGGNVTTEIVLGSPRRAISAFAGDWQADLVLVGSSKLRPWERKLIGSTPRSVFRRGPCSVEVVHPVREDTNAEPEPHLRILVATDGSEFSTAALHYLAERPWPGGSKVKIISVPEFPPLEEFSYLNAGEAEDLRVACEEEARICAAKGVEVLAGSALDVHSDVPKEREPIFQVILNEAEKWEADVIVLGSHGRSGFDPVDIGSVSEEVGLRSKCSVAVIRRPHASAAA
jgi:nucleotide-binding universal stress UspA family protein